MVSETIRKNFSQTLQERGVLKTHGYHLSKMLGQGGYAKVYLAYYHIPNGKPLRLACKIIDTATAAEKYIRKFLPQELRIISKINHPHIIQTHSIFQWESKFYIFMRHAEQGDLLDYIVDNGTVDEALARFWTRQLGLALQYLHILEIAHRDIKCENILVTNNYNVKITDFGFSRICLDANKEKVLSETFCGSISYASPQIFSGDPYDAKATDLWSLGIVIFVMLNRSPPFSSNNIRDMYFDQMQKNFKFRSKFKFSPSREVISLINHLLEPNEYTRYNIEQVLNSEWIAMDHELITLNEDEYTALKNAKILACTNKGDGCLNYEGEFRPHSLQRFQNNVNFFKEYDEGFDLNLLNSQINIAKRVSS